jgi:transcriptional regulator with XRE-family HTH domain
MDNDTFGILAGNGSSLLSEEQLRELVKRVAVDLQRQREESGTGDPDLGHILKEHREAQGYTQSELAEAAQVTRSTISKVEAGDRGMSLVTFCLLANALGGEFVEQFVWKMVEKVEETGRVGWLRPRPRSGPEKTRRAPKFLPPRKNGTSARAS